MDNVEIATEVCTCEAVPTQWEGTLTDGRTFYFRYRHGRASLGISGKTTEDAVVRSFSNVITVSNDRYDGSLDYDQYRYWFKKLCEERVEIPWL